jgi:hypothetical protein
LFRSGVLALLTGFGGGENGDVSDFDRDKTLEGDLSVLITIG